MVKEVLKEMTAQKQQSFADLNAAYQRLETLLEDPGVDLENLEAAVETTETCFARLTALVEHQGLDGLRRGDLEELFGKVQEIIVGLNEENGKLRQVMLNLQSGKRAMKAYHSPRQGMGYTEGKFLDRKK